MESKRVTLDSVLHTRKDPNGPLTQGRGHHFLYLRVLPFPEGHTEPFSMFIQETDRVSDIFKRLGPFFALHPLRTWQFYADGQKCNTHVSPETLLWDIQYDGIAVVRSINNNFHKWGSFDELNWSFSRFNCTQWLPTLISLRVHLGTKGTTEQFYLSWLEGGLISDMLAQISAFGDPSRMAIYSPNGKLMQHTDRVDKYQEMRGPAWVFVDPDKTIPTLFGNPFKSGVEFELMWALLQFKYAHKDLQLRETRANWAWTKASKVTFDENLYGLFVYYDGPEIIFGTDRPEASEYGTIGSMWSSEQEKKAKFVRTVKALVQPIIVAEKGTKIMYENERLSISYALIGHFDDDGEPKPNSNADGIDALSLIVSHLSVFAEPTSTPTLIPNREVIAIDDDAEGDTKMQTEPTPSELVKINPTREVLTIEDVEGDKKMQTEQLPPPFRVPRQRHPLGLSAAQLAEYQKTTEGQDSLLKLWQRKQQDVQQRGLTFPSFFSPDIQTHPDNNPEYVTPPSRPLALLHELPSLPTPEAGLISSWVRAVKPKRIPHPKTYTVEDLARVFAPENRQKPTVFVTKLNILTKAEAKDIFESLGSSLDKTLDGKTGLAVMTQKHKDTKFGIRAESLGVPVVTETTLNDFLEQARAAIAAKPPKGPLSLIGVDDKEAEGKLTVRLRKSAKE